MESQPIICKCWTEEILGVDEIVIQSPTGRRVRIYPDCPAIDKLPSEKLIVVGTLIQRIQQTVKERTAWESLEQIRLRKLADDREMKWVYELPEYKEHVKELHQRYPIGLGTVAMPLSPDEMALLLEISKL